MKKVFRLAAIAVLALGLTTACKQKAAEPEEIIDTTTIEEVVDTIIDEAVEEEVPEVVAEPVKKAAKPAAKKAATADVKSVNNSPVQTVGAPGSDVRQEKKNAETKAVLDNQRVTTNQDSKKH